jgi:predicted metal-dependent phosphoesterase TrpH
VDLTRDGLPQLTLSGFVDLHLHSTASDGEVPPTAVVERAAAAQVSAVALTDHDTVQGLPEAVEAGARLGVRVIAGCEFSVAAPWGEIHVLGYFLPVGSPDVEAFLIARREDRHRRAQAMVAKLGRLGVQLQMEAVLSIARGAALGRPHVARALVEQGAAPDVQEAFNRYLGWGRPAFEPKELSTLRQLADLVHGCGGVLSAAHLKDRGTRTNLKRLKADGLDAVEVRHPSHSPEVRDRLLRHADSLDLLPTGGSDWHGDTSTGGRRTSIGSQQVPAEWLARLEAHGSRTVDLP